MEAINKKVTKKDQRFDKFEFLFAFIDFENLTLKFTTVQHIFKSKSLVSFNLDIFLDKICEKQTQRQKTDYSTSTLFLSPLHK